ncbi:RNA polymerase subunit sigma-24 [Niallia circulans]|jgi:RNA polymerase sigma-70 factor, ECF subfamily|uniref:RNA polymerase subunit sigma-24 n=1 Tax=Niallia circulans TaxID=1397 RepID=A0A268FEV7_NIACI|nr:sigma-70 family RNA polymerase sigma factor [Niallia circulans]AYV68352.1 RNA polymerase subunit sigma-24 [Niallia circulans]NRG26715.1 sigma-70 family RNA polymerase sigma factor [Niallia circulans]PAD83916.1 RNA polymerase subunit sigma-24 [Niallia circulans]QJX64265.1 sigma-70 family RNA polymerase sigma factor [Niallia circulans]
MKDSIDTIYQTYFNDIYYFLLSLCHNHHSAEDLVQETFFRAHLYLETFQGKNVKAWLFTVAYHVFIDQFRKNKRLVVKENDFFQEKMENAQRIEETVLLKEEIQRVKTILKVLPEKQRMAVLLADFQELTTEEGAMVMNISPTYFKVLLFRGRQTIRQRGKQIRE